MAASMVSESEERVRQSDRSLESSSSGEMTHMTVNLPNGDTYEGTVANGLYHGKGRYFFSASKITYEGCFDNGERRGKGILYSQS